MNLNRLCSSVKKNNMTDAKILARLLSDGVDGFSTLLFDELLINFNIGSGFYYVG